MIDEHCSENCENCGKVIITYDYESGYDSHRYNWKTVSAYQEIRVNLPERENGHGFSAKICQECLDKDPSSHKFIYKKRLEWFDKEINNNEKLILINMEEVKKITDVEIPELKKKIEKIKKKKQEIIDKEK